MAVISKRALLVAARVNLRRRRRSRREKWKKNRSNRIWIRASNLDCLVTGAIYF